MLNNHSLMAGYLSRWPAKGQVGHLGDLATHHGGRIVGRRRTKTECHSEERSDEESALSAFSAELKMTTSVTIRKKPPHALLWLHLFPLPCLSRINAELRGAVAAR